MKLKHIIIILICSILIFIGYYFLIYWIHPLLSNRGLFGDSFGALNSFFTMLAFFGVVYTINQQNAIIKQNKREFDTQQKIQSLTTMIKVYQTKYSEAKRNDGIKANEYFKKNNQLTNELEKILNL
jgi:enterochelin esterase-like enzyme